jgi:hypothetical protein
MAANPSNADEPAAQQVWAMALGVTEGQFRRVTGYRTFHPGLAGHAGA